MKHTVGNENWIKMSYILQVIVLKNRVQSQQYIKQFFLRNIENHENDYVNINGVSSDIYHRK